ncbi:DoxX family protein [Simonsiella muelleri]|uniref:DoxX family protein n=1 Tax=Simonsiella muelleri ATCC 29453 TaxID=641147 RepID=V9HMY8_9NEIS|nr:DoxX family protein [Simonsiella muelleri]AUX60484.1 LuxR family transcriptional regulator [Simonsiella muelleri ATCC 29453]EFG31987.2 hypothetical protein HMPREF9021_00392 [Simonsiella muelleri ATCC 29453]UBQ54693.1 DoxX family protein [Simonsiella muelleri]
MFFLNQFQGKFLSLLRIVSGYMYLMHGSTKLLHIPYIEQFANVPMMSIYGVAGLLELVGGMLLILGLFTRPVAFLLSGQMAVAYLMAHTQPNFLLPILTGGELAALYSFLFLYLSSVGGGEWALDNLLFKKKSN